MRYLVKVKFNSSKRIVVYGNEITMSIWTKAWGSKQRND